MRGKLTSVVAGEADRGDERFMPPGVCRRRVLLVERMKSPPGSADNARQSSPTSPQHHLATRVIFFLKWAIQISACCGVSFTPRCKSPAEHKKSAVFPLFCVQAQDSQRALQPHLMRAKTGPI